MLDCSFDISFSIEVAPGIGVYWCTRWDIYQVKQLAMFLKSALQQDATSMPVLCSLPESQCLEILFATGGCWLGSLSRAAPDIMAAKKSCDFAVPCGNQRMLGLKLNLERHSFSKSLCDLTADPELEAGHQPPASRKA